MPKTKLLLIEDRAPIAQIIRSAVGESCEVVTADRSTAVPGAVQSHAPSVMVLNLDRTTEADREEALRLLQGIRQIDGAVKTVVCVGPADRQLAAQAARTGAFDVIVKPFEPELLRAVLRRALWMSALEQEAAQAACAPAGEDVPGMVGASQNINRIFDAIRKVSLSDVPLLISGENGTGKELTARAIHARSRRAAGPFVAIDCSAVPENLLEAELFGIERGVSGGLTAEQAGKLDQAQGGTLFLDEVGELPHALQIKLLRFLQERAFERASGRRRIELDVRVIAATKVDLKESIEQGAFREDLYYRLAVVHINLPPLRERGGDVMLLATVFLRQAAAHHQKQVLGFTKEAGEALCAYSWPGNVRELSNSVWRGVVMAEGSHLTPADLALPAASPSSEYESISLKVNQQRIETELIVKAFTLSQGNLSRAAQELGISRSTLYRRLRQYGMDRTPDSLRMPAGSEQAVMSDHSRT